MLAKSSKSSITKQVLIFFGVAFVFSWIFWISAIFTEKENRLLMIPGTYGPAFSAIILTLVLEGKRGLKELFGRFKIWRTNLLWYVFSFLGTAFIVLISLGIHTLLGGENLKFNDPKQWYLTIPVFFYVLVFSVLGEEIGWRGFALPRLQNKFSAFVSSLIIGFTWGVWHLPLFFIGWNFHSQIPFGLFLVQDIALAIIYTWIYNSTGGSLLIVNLFHAASNTTLGILPVLPMDTDKNLRPLWITVILLLVVSGSVVVIGGTKHLSRKGERIRSYIG